MVSGNGLGDPDAFHEGPDDGEDDDLYEGREGAEDDDLPDVHGVPDATLGGYVAVHDRSPAFTGPDGLPYTVSMEVERVASLNHPFVGYLVFPRWAATGLGVVGHVQTPILGEGAGPEEVRAGMEALPLERVKQLLDEAIRRTGRGETL